MGSLDRKKPWNPDWLLQNNCYRFKNSNIGFWFVTWTMISMQTLLISVWYQLENGR